MKGETVDLSQAETFTAPATQNRNPSDLPLSAFLYNLINGRKAQAGGSPLVFPGKSKAART